MEPEEVETCHHPDFDWINPELGSDDPMDEVLACTECGFIRHTARQVQVA